MQFGSTVYPWALRHLLLPAGDWATSQGILPRLQFLREAQWWPADRIDHWRSAQLRQLVRTAYSEVPFYRHLFDSAGVSWSDIREVGDLQRLPVVTKSMLRACAGQTTRPTGFRCHVESSSGSTGEPFLVSEDSQTAGYRRAAFMLALEWAGWKAGEPHLQTGATLGRDWRLLLKDMLLRCHYVPAMHLDDESMDRVLDTISTRRLRHLWGYPCALNALALRARAVGWNGSPMSSVVTWADQLYPEYRVNIETTFRTKVLDTYGCAEGMQISAQCGHGEHYHVQAMDTIVEYLDECGEPVKVGRLGRVVLTRLLPGPMPFLRYDVGDLAVPCARQACSCGRQWELMQSIVGRQTDVVVSPSGKRFFLHFFSLYLECFPEIQEYQVVQTSSASVLIRAVCSPSEGLGTRVADRLRREGLEEMSVCFESVDRIPLTPGGKRRWVIGRQDQSRDVAA